MQKRRNQCTLSSSAVFLVINLLPVYNVLYHFRYWLSPVPYSLSAQYFHFHRPVSVSFASLHSGTNCSLIWVNKITMYFHLSCIYMKLTFSPWTKTLACHATEELRDIILVPIYCCCTSTLGNERCIICCSKHVSFNVKKKVGMTHATASPVQ